MNAESYRCYTTGMYPRDDLALFTLQRLGSSVEPYYNSLSILAQAYTMSPQHHSRTTRTTVTETIPSRTMVGEEPPAEEDSEDHRPQRRNQKVA